MVTGPWDGDAMPEAGTEIASFPAVARNDTARLLVIARSPWDDEAIPMAQVQIAALRPQWDWLTRPDDRCRPDPEGRKPGAVPDAGLAKHLWTRQVHILVGQDRGPMTPSCLQVGA